MSRLIITAAMFTALAAATPVAAFPGASSTASVDSVIVKADYVCGPGYFVGPYGRYCWPQRYAPPPRRRVERRVRVECPPGYHFGPYGQRCWPD